MMAPIYRKVYNKVQLVRWLSVAWTIDHIDSPLLVDFYNRVILTESSQGLKLAEKLLIGLCSYFDAHHLAIIMPQKMSTSFLDEVSSQVSKVSLLSDPTILKKEKEVDLIIDNRLHTSNLSPDYLPLITMRGSILPAQLKSQYNIKIDLWCCHVFWFDHRIKEYIDIKLSPYRKRWKLGISRPLAVT